ncbi:major facilitator superfamily domain-containing protein [Mycena capillaripes]|nr:major facilitator superfamily domain-containing protein [Mycena capillaripes]
MDDKISPKNSGQIFEEKGSVGPQQDLYNTHIDTTKIDEKKLLRKIDIHLVPWFSLLYLLSFLDRTSIGKCLYNLEKDLKISDTQYLISLTVFFIRPVPSNIFLKRLRPSVWFAFLMVMWGLIMVRSTHSTTSAGFKMGLRWMLGTFEAGLYPGMAYHLSCWYKRSELGIRAAVLNSATTTSGAFGGLLAAAISNMDGIGGKPAWAWIFIIEGLATMLAGIASYWMVHDFPDTAKFLTETERTFVIRRLQGDDQYSAAGEKLRMRNILSSFRDWKTWFSMGCDMPLYAFSLFTPSIINQSCCVALYADKYGRRGYCNIVMLSLGGIGYIILIVSRNAALSYFAVYVATWCYRARDTPWYPLGLVLMYICIGLVANSAMLVLLKRENARRDRGERDEVIGFGAESEEGGEDNGNGRYATVEDAKREKGDNWSGYRYML